MKRRIAIVVALAAAPLWAQDEYPLWEGDAPHSKSNSLVETVEQAWGARIVHTFCRRPMPAGR